LHSFIQSALCLMGWRAALASQAADPFMEPGAEFAVVIMGLFLGAVLTLLLVLPIMVYQRIGEALRGAERRFSRFFAVALITLFWVSLAGLAVQSLPKVSRPWSTPIIGLVAIAVLTAGTLLFLTFRRH